MKIHDATDTALGFYYQTFFALLTLIKQDTDNATIGVEQLDDVELEANGQTLLYQLKHSIKHEPPKLSINSRALWRTLKVWCDVLPIVTLSETSFCLITVSSIQSSCPLHALTESNTDRIALVEVLRKEASRVVNARNKAKLAGIPLPHKDRAHGCEAYLSLSDTDQLNLIRRVAIRQDSPTIQMIENEITKYLLILPMKQRAIVAKKLIEWWEREMVYSLCDMRSKIVSRTELQNKISDIVSDIAQEKLAADYESLTPPNDYQPNSMLARQIELVRGKQSDLLKAIREEWRAREQRSKWLHSDPSMASRINNYDQILEEKWADRHQQILENCQESCEEEKCQSGLELLRWTHEQAPNVIRPVTPDWNASYYISGSYQVLAINLKVGWHPEYSELLQVDEQ